MVDAESRTSYLTVDFAVGAVRLEVSMGFGSDGCR